MSDVQGCTSAVGGTMPGAAFDAFGLRRDAANWDYDLTSTQITALKDDTEPGCTFQEQLDNVGLIHMNERMYDPLIGWLISADLVMIENRYTCACDDPLEFSGWRTIITES